MKMTNIYRWLLLVGLMLGAGAGLRAEDGAAAPPADPSGTWRWTAELRGHEFENKVNLKYENGTLSGEIDNRAGKQAIANASYADGQVKFTVERKFRRKTFVTTYQGKLDGDTITGTMSVSLGDDAEPKTAEWKAKRG